MATIASSTACGEYTVELQQVLLANAEKEKMLSSLTGPRLLLM